MLALWLSLGLLFTSVPQAFSGVSNVFGRYAKSGEIPYVVAIRNYGDYVCEGSIIDEYWILTAAHCVTENYYHWYYFWDWFSDWGYSDYTVEYGATTFDQTNNIDVRNIYYYDDYIDDSEDYLNDIALLKLEEPLNFDKSVYPVVLPPAYNATPVGASAVIARWKVNVSGERVPRGVDVQVYSDESCELIHRFSEPINRVYHVCAAENEINDDEDDSGGPLVVDGVQVGIKSWTAPEPNTIAYYSGVYTKVSTYVNWINAHINNY